MYCKNIRASSHHKQQDNFTLLLSTVAIAIGLIAHWPIHLEQKIQLQQGLFLNQSNFFSF